jgi:hypothetical protein
MQKKNLIFFIFIKIMQTIINKIQFINKQKQFITWRLICNQYEQITTVNCQRQDVYPLSVKFDERMLND